MKKIMMGSIITIAVIAAGIYLHVSAARGGNAGAPQIIEVKKADLSTTVAVTGSLKPRIQITLTSSKKGQVEELLVDEGDTVTQGQILATVSSDDRINLLNAASRNLDTARKTGTAAGVQKAEEELRVAEAAYQKMPIIAPISGLVTLRNVEPGQKVETTTTILEISDELVVKALVDETDIGKVREGMKSTVVVDAYPDVELQAAIIKIAYTATTESNVTSYEVLLKLNSSRGVQLKSGMSADVTIIVTEKKGAIKVPAAAVQQQDGRQQVLVIGSDNQPRPCAVTVGATDSDGVEVTAGLQEGDKIVVLPAGSAARAGAAGKNTSTKKKDFGGPPPFMMGGGPR